MITLISVKRLGRPGDENDFICNRLDLLHFYQFYNTKATSKYVARKQTNTGQEIRRGAFLEIDPGDPMSSFAEGLLFIFPLRLNPPQVVRVSSRNGFSCCFVTQVMSIFGLCVNKFDIWSLEPLATKMEQTAIHCHQWRCI